MSTRIGPRSCCGAICVCVFLQSFGYADEEPALQRRLRTEGPQAWTRYQDFWRTLQGTAWAERRELTGKDKNKVTFRGLSRWRRCPGHSLDELERFGLDSYNGIIAVHNPRYSFTLIRNQKDKPWIVRDITEKSAENAEPPKDLPPGLDFGNPARSLPYLFGFPDFKVIDVVPDSDSGEELARMTFSYSPKENAQSEARSGWLILDPRHDWVIRKGEISVFYDANTNIKQVFFQNYKNGSDGHPIPTNHGFKAQVIEKRQVTYEYEGAGELDLHEDRNVPESEFTLSAFGFPEPAWLRPANKTRWYLWAAVGGFGCLVAGYLVRRYFLRSA